jgi:hypothetical protein
VYVVPKKPKNTLNQSLPTEIEMFPPCVANQLSREASVVEPSHERFSDIRLDLWRGSLNSRISLFSISLEGTQSDNLIDNLRQQLNEYILRIKGDVELETDIDYGSGLAGPCMGSISFFKSIGWRELNRKVSYQLANSLLEELSSESDIAQLFSSKNIVVIRRAHVYALSSSQNLQPRLERYLLQTNSRELKRIIKFARKLAANHDKAEMALK